MFGRALALLAEHGLVNGERIGVDASTMEAALRTIVRRETGETYREMLKRMAEESGIETPRPTISCASIAPARARSCLTRTG